MSTPQAELESQLIDLQTRFAFQEDVLHEVNRTLMLQQRQLERLELRCRRLEQHCQELMTVLESQAEPLQQPPPHY